MEAMKIVFLDRDGVINKFPGNGNYVTKVKDFHFIPGSVQAIRLLTKAGYTIFVISNQAGVAKGVYSKDKLNRITRKMMKGVTKVGGKIKKVYYCTHLSGEGCGCRKPGIGSIRKALDSLNQTIHTAKKGYFVGDTESDMAAGHNAGCKTIFVLSGRENEEYMRKWKVRPDYIANNLLAAVKIILTNGSPQEERRAAPGQATVRAKESAKKRSPSAASLPSQQQVRLRSVKRT
jgi:D-glycero-D-manno-heptose 1,7-bisphosphate phosphatase